MDRDTAVSQIQEKLGFRTGLTQAIINNLQFEQDELEQGGTSPFWLLKEDQPFQVVAAVPATATPIEMPLPVGFMKESDDQAGNLRYYQSLPGPAVYLTKMDLAQAEQFFFGPRKSWWENTFVTVQQSPAQFTPGTPVAYVLRRNTVRFYPGPDQNYTLTWSYFAHDTTLLGPNTTNGWLTNVPQLLIGRAGLKTALTVRDVDAAKLFNIILHGNPEGVSNPATHGAEKSFLALLYERGVAGRRMRMGARL